MKKFLSGIVCGLGGVSPGLSGSVMLVIAGYYDKTIEAIGTFFKRPKDNFLFLFPLFLGIGLGVLLFGQIVSLLLDKYEMIIRLTFLGFILGTLPLFYKKVKQKDFRKKYYFIMILAFIIGGAIMFVSTRQETLDNLNFMQSVFMGIVLSASTIIPGVDSSVILSSLGLYELFIDSIATINLTILMPAMIGVGGGVLVFSSLINHLIKKHYTITYTVIFGLFISLVPSVINESVVLSFDLNTLFSILFLLLGIFVSYKLSMYSLETED